MDAPTTFLSPDGGASISGFGSLSTLIVDPLVFRMVRNGVGLALSCVQWVITGRGSQSGDADVHRLQAFVDSFGAALAADAGVLHSAEGRSGIGDHTRIEAQHPRFQPLGEAQRASHVACV